MLTDERFTMSLVGGRKSVSEAMNEVLWEDTPAENGVGRWASRDTMLGNRRIKAGDMVCLGLAAANTDPQMRPDGSKLTSGNNAFLSFGHGEHRCPVAAQEIAETIARTAIEVLLDRLPDIDFVIPAEGLTRRPSPWARGMTTLPAHFTPTPAVSQMAGPRRCNGTPMHRVPSLTALQSGFATLPWHRPAPHCRAAGQERRADRRDAAGETWAEEIGERTWLWTTGAPLRPGGL